MVVLGDMNFRVLNSSTPSLSSPHSVWNVLHSSDERRKRMFDARDELKQAIQYGALPPYREGVNNVGASTFMPTGKMRHGRQSGDVQVRAYHFGRNETQNPSWCDRILYARADEVVANTCRPHAVRGERYVEGRGSIECSFYNRFEHGQSMTKSDHSAVIASILVTPEEFPGENATNFSNDKEAKNATVDTRLSSTTVATSSNDDATADANVPTNTTAPNVPNPKSSQHGTTNTCSGESATNGNAKANSSISDCSASSDNSV